MLLANCLQMWAVYRVEREKVAFLQADVANASSPPPPGPNMPVPLHVNPSVETQADAPWGLVRISSRQNTFTTPVSSKDYRYKAAAGAGTWTYVVDSGLDGDHPELKVELFSAPTLLIDTTPTVLGMGLLSPG